MLNNLQPIEKSVEVMKYVTESRDLLDDPNVAAAFGYGSGVYGQGYKGDVDMMIVARDTAKFMNDRKKDYHLSSIVSTKKLAELQKSAGAIIYTGLRRDLDRIKVGLTSIDDAVLSMTTWEPSIYVAGRFHDPTYEIKNDSDELKLAMKMNYAFAARVAVLLFDPKEKSTSTYYTNEYKYRYWYKKIAQESYWGDPRPEPSNKIEKKVEEQEGGYQEIYTDPISEIRDEGYIDEKALGKNSFRVTISDEQMFDFICTLPPKYIIPLLFTAGLYTNDPSALRNVTKFLIRTTVFGPSAIQTIKGAVSYPPKDVPRYAVLKILKGLGLKHTKLYSFLE